MTNIFEISKKIREQLAIAEAKFYNQFTSNSTQARDSFNYNLLTHDKIFPYNYFSNEINFHTYKWLGGILTVGSIVAATGLAYMHLSGKVKSISASQGTDINAVGKLSLQAVSNFGEGSLELLQEDILAEISPEKLLEKVTSSSIELMLDKTAGDATSLSKTSSISCFNKLLEHEIDELHYDKISFCDSGIMK